MKAWMMIPVMTLLSGGFGLTGAQGGIRGRPAADRRRSARSAEVERKLRSIIIPEIDFRQAHIEDVVEFLVAVSRELDPEGRGVNIILKLNGPSAREAEKRQPQGPITFRASHLPAGEALASVARAAGLRHRIQDGVVMVLGPEAADGEIVQRVYNVLPTIVDRIEEVGRDLP